MLLVYWWMLLLTTNNRLTESSNLQTKFCFMPRALYQVSFSNFSNVIHCIQKFGKQCKIKWTKKKNQKKKNKEKKENKKKERRKRKI